MVKWLFHGCSEFSEQLDKTDCIGIFFIEKDGFLSMPNICFREAQIFWNDVFSVSYPGISITLTIMKKDVVYDLITFQKIL